MGVNIAVSLVFPVMGPSNTEDIAAIIDASGLQGGINAWKGWCWVMSDGDGNACVVVAMSDDGDEVLMLMM